MKMTWLATWPLLVLMAACAHQQTTVMSSPDMPVCAGTATAVAPPAAVADAMDAEFKALRKALSGPGVQAGSLAQRGDAAICLQFAASQSFDAGSAELRPSALETYARLAATARAARDTVVHVRVRSGDAAGLSQSLSDRRAAAVAAYLTEQGLDEGHLRDEGIAAAQPGIVQILIKPVIPGRESEAWMSAP